MRFAFDWGGSLENNECLRQLTRDLRRLGHEVHIIPAAGITPTDETYFSWFRSLDIPFDGFHRVLVVDGMTPEMVAAAKVKKMKEIGCHILYDDNAFNLAAVREAGMIAVEIKGEHAIPFPDLS